MCLSFFFLLYFLSFLHAGHQMSGFWLKSLHRNVICVRRSLILYIVMRVCVCARLPRGSVIRSTCVMDSGYRNAKYKILSKCLHYETVVMNRYLFECVSECSMREIFVNFGTHKTNIRIQNANARVASSSMPAVNHLINPCKRKVEETRVSWNKCPNLRTLIRLERSNNVQIRRDSNACVSIRLIQVFSRVDVLRWMMEGANGLRVMVLCAKRWE